MESRISMARAPSAQRRHPKRVNRATQSPMQAAAKAVNLEKHRATGIDWESQPWDTEIPKEMAHRLGVHLASVYAARKRLGIDVNAALKAAIHDMANAFQRQSLGLPSMDAFNEALDRARDALGGVK